MKKTKPKKLIRNKILYKLKPEEWEEILDKDELNKLYYLKILEELEEIKESNHKDIFEFVDLLQAVYSFVFQNGFTFQEIVNGILKKSEKGIFTNIALNNLNPNNPSNKLYFNETNKTTNSSKEKLV